MTAAERAFEFRRALPPVSRTTDPETSHKAERDLDMSGRRRSQKREILEKLEAGPTTNIALSRISLKYTGRISDLRADGWIIDATPQGGGVTRYDLRGKKTPRPKPSAATGPEARCADRDETIRAGGVINLDLGWFDEAFIGGRLVPIAAIRRAFGGERNGSNEPTCEGNGGDGASSDGPRADHNGPDVDGDGADARRYRSRRG